MKRHQEPTTTTLIVEALQVMGEIVSERDLCTLTDRDANRVSAACHWLRKAGVLGLATDAGGKRHWLLLPPHLDQRTRVRTHTTLGGKKKPHTRAGRRRKPLDPQSGNA